MNIAQQTQTAGHHQCAPLDARALRIENRHYAGSGGISRENRSSGFVPAFLDSSTGQTYRSRYSDGRPAPMHILEGLPSHLLIECSDSLSAKACVVSGFLRCGDFFTRAEAAAAVQECQPA